MLNKQAEQVTRLIWECLRVHAAKLLKSLVAFGKHNQKEAKTMKISKAREIEICFQHIAEYDKIAQEKNINGVDTQYVAILWRRRLREINQKRHEKINKRRDAQAVQS